MDTDILVVGAGPTGLLLAIDLLRRGVRCRLVDQAVGPATTSRALVLHARSQELLDLHGLREGIAERAVALTGMAFVDNGRQVGKVGQPALSYASISLPQQDTEAVLRAALEAAGGRVEWSSPLTGLRSEAHGVKATVAGREIACQWLVGCDGAHSAVRKAVGIEFAGGEVVEAAQMADVELDWDRAPDEIGMFFSHDGAMTAVPMGRGRWRIVAAVDDAGSKPSEDFFARALERRAGRRVSNLRFAWMSTFSAHCRLAATYRAGRTLLAGDAAHVHSPVGGQGMNTGLQDALNLGWKLAAVLRGADEKLIDSYEAERRPVAQNVIRANASMTRLVVARRGLPKLVRTHVLPRALAIPAINARLGMGVSGLGVEYSSSPLSGVGGGRRAPYRSGFYRPEWELFASGAGRSALVRPDGYVAAIGGRSEAERHLARWIGSAAPVIDEGRNLPTST